MVTVGSVRSRASEIHRYFPEWADRPALSGTQREADRNSYLAGGYAEEFGYRDRADRVPAISPLDGDPEQSRLWRAQIGALHPGYPECPRPCDRGSSARLYGSGVRQGWGVVLRSAPRAMLGEMTFRTIRVGERGGAAREHRGGPFGLVSLLKERRIRRRQLNDVL